MGQLVLWHHVHLYDHWCRYRVLVGMERYLVTKGIAVISGQWLELLSFGLERNCL